MEGGKIHIIEAFTMKAVDFYLFLDCDASVLKNHNYKHILGSSMTEKEPETSRHMEEAD